MRVVMVLILLIVSMPSAEAKNFMDYFLQSKKMRQENEYHQKLAENASNSDDYDDNDRLIERSLQEMDRDAILKSNEELNENINSLRQELAESES